MSKPKPWGLVRQGFFEGRTITDLAKTYNVSRRQIQRYAQKEMWREARGDADYEYQQKKIRRFDGDEYTEELFCDWVEQEMSSIAQFLNLPPIVTMRREHLLSKKGRIDFLLSHPDQGFSIIEAKTGMTVPYAAVGQLIYYLEIFTSINQIPPEKIRLYIFSDQDLDPVFLSSLNHVKHKIICLKLSPALTLKRLKPKPLEP